MINNKQGSISVEALIAVTTFIMLMVFLISLFQFVALEDQILQMTYDAASELDSLGYLYEKIGDVESNWLSLVKGELGSEKIQWLEVTLDKVDFSSVKEKVLKSNFERFMQSLNENNQLKHVALLNFDLDHDCVTLKFEYEHLLPLGQVFHNEVEIEHRLWLFGSEPECYNHTTLEEVMNDSASSMSVYVTKTGTKYHLGNCFYIVRVTTDQKSVQVMTLKEAENNGHTPCSRCILKRRSIW